MNLKVKNSSESIQIFLIPSIYVQFSLQKTQSRITISQSCCIFSRSKIKFIIFRLARSDLDLRDR